MGAEPFTTSPIFLSFRIVDTAECDTLQDEFFRGVIFRENCHFMNIRGLIYLRLKTATLYEELTPLRLPIELTLRMRALRVSFSI